MTITTDGSAGALVEPAAEPADGSAAGLPADPAAYPVDGPEPEQSKLWLPGAVLSLVGLILVSFCFYIAVVSQLSFSRAQQLAYDDFRAALSAGTAPVGPTFVEEPEVEGAQVPTDETAAQGGSSTQAPEQQAPQPMLLPAGTPVALLSIPAIGVRGLVVLEDTTSAVTRDGPGHTRSSAMPGQMGWSQILGRRWAYGAPFRDLPDLLVGDDILVTTGQGEHRYEVTGFRKPGDPVPRREAGQGRLVLMTADGRAFMPDQPVIVDAVLRSDAQPVGAAAVFPDEPASDPMQGDPSGWFAIVLWSQAVAVAAAGVAWARRRWGPRQAWLVGVPLITALGLGLADSVATLLPNLL
ncbi:class E sortase [Monashia sp. NPDC004114]